MSDIRSEKCFADIKEGVDGCYALTEKKCEGCLFYKPASSVDLNKIKKDIRNYTQAHLPRVNIPDEKI